jgi:hypothetical protein
MGAFTSSATGATRLGANPANELSAATRWKRRYRRRLPGRDASISGSRRITSLKLSLGPLTPSQRVGHRYVRSPCRHSVHAWPSLPQSRGSQTATCTWLKIVGD